MLLNRSTLQGIADGRITLAFRRWLRPTVRKGTLLRTEIGEIEIQAVDAIGYGEVTDAAARRAGYESSQDLFADMHSGPGRTLYRIKLRLAGPDQRTLLRELVRMTADDRNSLSKRLEKYDRFSRCGPWTRAVIQVIARYPGMKAGALADETGFEREWLKVQIRKLKELGLTESLQPGYRLSPRGEAFWASIS